MNHLANESSPYLLQHRDNPVDWFPWGDEAFEKARETDRPIFLSIGYATCHWCHVMEHESFADAEVASLMNRWFVSIKVDREERPDIDNIYMTVCQLMGGHCGWPLNVVLTPDRRPFFVATYVPKTNRQGRVGMLDLLPRLAAAWSERRVDVDGAAQEVTEALRSIAAPAVGSVRLESGTLVKARDELGQRFDDRYGGFGGAPKFPSSHNLLFLLRYAQRTGDDEARQWAVKTLRSIRFGGIFDQIGYGVHRYSTDASWTVPHFEKMLYDQALHVLAYAECFLATGDQLYRRTALQVAEYVLRGLTSKEGAFFSAEDADSEGVEGKFYVWSTEEIRQVLGPDADHVLSILQMRDEGNFHDEATGQLTATNIPYLGSTGESFALATDDRLEAARQKLLRHRARRPRPLLDDKILTDWNGLMIGALAFAGRALGESRLIDAAIQASHFALEVMYTPEGLLHRYRNGDAGIRGHLDDYAFLCYGLTELYQATLDTRHLSSAVSLLDDSLDVFWDGESGGFFLAAAERTDLLVRNKDFNDGAIPSGNSVALLNLIRLERITGRASYGDKADEMLRVAAPTVVRYPSAYTGLLLGLEFLRAPSETVLVGDRDHEELRSMREALNERYLPSNVVLWADGAGSTLAALAPHVANYMRDMDGKPRAYVCRNYVCASPASSVSEMLERFTDLA